MRHFRPIENAAALAGLLLAYKRAAILQWRFVGDGMTGLIANAGLLTGFFIVLASPALIRRTAYGWVLLAVVIVLADFCVTEFGAHYQKAIPYFAGCQWNWFGKLLSVGVMSMIAVVLASSGKLSFHEMGISVFQSRGTGRAILLVALPAIVLQAVLTATLFGDTTAPARETILFQA